MTADAALTQACEDRDFADWHRGCPWCAVWVVRVDQAPLQAHWQQARALLGDALLPRYARQPHITLAYRGLMAGAAAHAAAEFGAQQCLTDVQQLQQLRPQPWTLSVHGAGSFSTVPYLDVPQGRAPLLAVHQALSPQPPYPGWHYAPHVTLGHYAHTQPLAPLLHRLQQGVQAQPPLQCTVSALWLARYRTDDIAGPLYWEGCYDLRSQQYVAQPGALLQLPGGGRAMQGAARR